MQKGENSNDTPDALQQSPEYREEPGGDSAETRPEASDAPGVKAEAPADGTSADGEGKPDPSLQNIVFVVEHRQRISTYMGESALFSYRAELAFIASTLEKAVAWCRKNIDYAPHSLERTWDFAIRKRELDTDLVGGGLVMVLDWDGEVTGWTV